MKGDTVANVLEGDSVRQVSASQLRLGDVVSVAAGEIVPGDGDVIEGIASVDESAITGESAPVIREAGGDRSAVTGGTRVLSDRIEVRITSNPGETFLDRMISLVEGAARQKTPNEIALDILLAALTLVFVITIVSLQPFAVYSGAPQSIIVLVALFVCLIPTTIGALLSAIGIAGMNRLVQRNEHHHRQLRTRVVRERLQRHRDQQEDERQPAEQDVERDLVRCLLARCAFDERNHAVQEALAGVRRDTDAQEVADDRRAARDRAADVGAGLLQDGGGLARDRSLADVRYALDDVSVSGDVVSGVDADDIAHAQFG
jgi:cation transport ATPase